MIAVCIIITGLSGGGAENMLFKLLQNIDRSRFNVQVVSLTTRGVFGSRIEAMGIPVFALGLRSGFSGLACFFRLITIIRKFRPDIVHTWMYHADLFGGVAARVVGVRHVVWGIRNFTLDPKHTKRSTRIVMTVSAMLSKWIPSLILSCSKRATSVHVDAGYCSEKFRFIPNGFDFEKFVPSKDARLAVRKELGLSRDSRLVGLIARFDPQKNHLGFLESTSRIRRTVGDVKFLLAGSGVTFSCRELSSAIERNSLNGCVFMLGPRDDIPSLIASLDVLVSPSHAEAFSNVIGEAMACGVPCVVTDVGDSKEIVADAGRVVSKGDMDSLADNVAELLLLGEAERLSMSIRAREVVYSRFEVKRVATMYMEVYEELNR